MTLLDLTSTAPGVKKITGLPETEISGICNDSRRVKPGCLFICMPGMKFDGHEFAPQAVQSGAVALLVEHELELDVPQVVVESVRMAFSYVAAKYYGCPADKLKLIGITGTKGKTTTSYLVKSILEAAGHKSGLIGTICSMIADEVIPAKLTTPDCLELQELLARMVAAGVEYVVMEVSAHAIALDRVSGMYFEVGAFSNFSQDHLDFFGDMDRYFDCKMGFFHTDQVRKIVYNRDEERVKEGFDLLDREALSIGISEKSDIYAKNIDFLDTNGGSMFLMTWHKHFQMEVHTRLTGLFNIYNALLACGICVSLGIDEKYICQGLESVQAVPGRVELLDTGTPYRVILDYAHSPDSLQNVLQTVRQTIQSSGRLIALFGCGGNRDAAKRPLMGEIGGQMADFCILTSDNPRSEDPMDIIHAVEDGIRNTDCEYVVIENRREAIRYALNFAKPSDVIVLAGKGHETYQEIRGVRYPFDEKVVVAELLKEIRNA